MGIEKYRVHEVAKDFGLPTKTITEILTKYAQAPKNHMQVLEERELAVIFDYLTQHNQVENIESIFADVYHEPKPAQAKPAQPQQSAAKPAAKGESRPQSAAPQADKSGEQPRAQGGKPEQAQAHLLRAWELARPDDLIEGFGEHHGLLGGMLEAVLKKDWPEDFRRIIAITYRFSAGWRKVHNPETGHPVADNLTTTEFAAAMLAARGWTNQEIADHMHISPNTVKRHIAVSLEKLNIRRRQDLKQFMLL